MNKEEALALIDAHKNQLTDPVQHLHWIWLSVTIKMIPDEVWDEYVRQAAEIISKAGT